MHFVINPHIQGIYALSCCSFVLYLLGAHIDCYISHVRACCVPLYAAHEGYCAVLCCVMLCYVALCGVWFESAVIFVSSQSSCSRNWYLAVLYRSVLYCSVVQCSDTASDDCILLRHRMLLIEMFPL